MASSERTRERQLDRRVLLLGVLTVAVLAAAAPPAGAQENDDCLGCHSDDTLVGVVGGEEMSVYVDAERFARSVHADFGCIDCHMDIEDLPHADDLEPVDCMMCHEQPRGLGSSVHGRLARRDGVPPGVVCASCHGVHDVADPNPGSPAARESVYRTMCGKCHEDEAARHGISVHARVAGHGDELAPTCVTCHGSHEVKARADQNSPMATMNIPQLCGSCHHEGSPVEERYDIPQESVLENYSQSIHGEGLYRQGLTVTAVCTSCHTPHQVLPHTDPRSSVHRANVAETCMTCHARIEEVHVQVIEGRLWEEQPHVIPSCVECHSPHEVRRPETLPGGATNENCFECHSNPTLVGEIAGQRVSMYVDRAAYNSAAHARTACAQCHNEVTPNHPERPCATVSEPVRVDCSICHAAEVLDHEASTHGQLAAQGDPDAPVCLDCHGHHTTLSHRIPASPTFARNVPLLCAQCHRSGEVAARRIGHEPNPVDSYEESIHGKGLVESGLVVSATCTDCHTTHRVLPPADPESSVHTANIADTCGTCHHGIEETFKTSIHWPGNGASDDAVLPTCESCHTSHSIARTDVEGFRGEMMEQCGKCHADEAETFFDTYHGKVSRLGSEGAAKCYDCHGTHNILPTDDPRSTLSRRHVVDTCAQCHPAAHLQFAGYLSHATHHDQDKYPFLFYSFWFMTILLVGTLTFALLHTFAWLWRLYRTREQWVAVKAHGGPLYERFTRTQRTMHLIMLLSFFTLALTGMALKFSYMPWAQGLSWLLGGFAAMGILHRVGAVVLLVLFAFHLRQVWIGKQDSGKGWIDYIFGRNSLMFNLTDLRQFYESIRWFLGRGPRPHYGRFTYWEKFDYFAVFWGVFIIGSTGLMLWFPELFTRVLPGWSINVATIIHSDEALLAVGFIFTIHFFNTHFRPDKFPMDPVIFTGRVPLEELKHDKPGEYDDLVEAGRVEELEQGAVEPVPARFERAARIFGFTALGIGLTLIFLIVYTFLFGYR